MKSPLLKSLLLAALLCTASVGHAEYLGWPLSGTPDGGTANDFGNRQALYPIGPMPENGTVIGVDIYVGFNDAAGHQMRVAIYKGGTTPGSDLNGATLVEDLGAHTLVGTGWVRVASVTAPALVTGEQIIVGIKSAGGTGSYWVPYDIVDPGFDVLGFVTYTSDEVNSEADPWNATIAGASSTSTRWGAARIEYTAAATGVTQIRTLESISSGAGPQRSQQLGGILEGH